MVISTLSLPHCHFHIVASTLPFPHCHFRVVNSTLSLPHCLLKISFCWNFKIYEKCRPLNLCFPSETIVSLYVFQDMFRLNNQSHSYNTRSSKLFPVPPTRTNLCYLTHWAMKLWKVSFCSLTLKLKLHFISTYSLYNWYSSNRIMSHIHIYIYIWLDIPNTCYAVNCARKGSSCQKKP